MAEYTLTPQARTGFRALLEDVEGEFGVRVAERVLDKLEAAFELLAENPGAGHCRADLTDDDEVRFWPVGPTLIAYRCVDGRVEVLFIERGELDWGRVLRPDAPS